MAKKRKKPDYLNEMQFKFFEEYIKTNNITQSAIYAGYNKKTAGVQGSRLLSSVKGQRYMEERFADMDNEKVASADEVMEYLTSVMRGEINDQFDLEPSLAERTKAGIELAKRLVDRQPTPAPITIINNIPKPQKASK